MIFPRMVNRDQTSGSVTRDIAATGLESVSYSAEPGDGQHHRNPTTTQTDRSLGGCIPMTIIPKQPMTLSRASGRYQRPRFHDHLGPGSPVCPGPQAVGNTKRCKESSYRPR